ncbi:hypothetical protein BgiMline_018244 [Biomphalaria glabrata]|uniref:RanBP2-type domain-containing protein n=1 Tax=Biomphalaria glabrata TaxID=6526 RepID=A0A2C9LUE0_BIOGL|nr:SPATA2 [Biomphalaria glabrata]
MSEPITKARGLYIKLHQHQAFLTDRDKENLTLDIRKFISISIKEISSHEALYTNSVLLHMLKIAVALRSTDNDDLMPIARAFDSLEKYLLLLVEQPWKPEFRRIKTYGGFYRTKIKYVLPDCDTIFELAGYHLFSEGSLMIFNGPIQKIKLLLLAFDCKVSSTLCTMIVEHYHRMKGLGLCLDDAVSNFMQNKNNDYPLVKSVPHSKPNIDFINGHLINFDSQFDQLDITPPAIPKRQPLPNGSNGRKSNVRHESELILFSPPALPERVSAPIIDSSPSNSVLPPNIPPLLSDNMIPEAFVPEVWPDLQQGTSDDHIRESLKIVEQKNIKPYGAVPSYENLSRQDEFKYLNYNAVPQYSKMNATMQGINSVAGLTHPANPRSRQGSSQSSYDEGIDLSRSSGMSSSKYYPSVHGTNPTSQHLKPSFSPSFMDQGYRTGPPSEGAYAQSSNYLFQQPTIYHAPNILTDGYMARQAAGPPPIPSRTLKPSYTAKPVQEDVGDSVNGSDLFSPTALARGQSQSEIIMSQTYKVGPTTPNLALPSSKQSHLRDKMSISKANSLKYSGKGHLVEQHLTGTRSAHSMDLTLLLWRCKSCTAENSASENVCFACSCSRKGPDTSLQPECGKTHKACPKCTYENAPSRTECEMCREKLLDKFTYV